MSPSTIFETRASGKLLLSGEYFVLDGATALAMPVRFGQSLRVERRLQPAGMLWESRDWDGSVWFSAEYELPYLGVVETSDRSVAEMLASIFRECQRQHPDFLSNAQGVTATTVCDFPRAWGLGTSSTIIAAITRWAGVDPYPVLRNTLGGSGYDIACAYAESPLLYHLDGEKPVVRNVAFSPAFADQLYFVYLEKKQNSRDGIARYREKARDVARYIPEVSLLTERMLNAETLRDFEAAMCEHEQLIGKLLDFALVKDRHFADYWGEVKSLGAWGGDFVMATSQQSAAETRAYFVERGFNTVLRWDEMFAPM
jgi:mevalonate kinase